MRRCRAGLIMTMVPVSSPGSVLKPAVWLLQMPDFALLHTLSASREALTSLRFNSRGDWLALGCASLARPRLLPATGCT